MSIDKKRMTDAIESAAKSVKSAAETVAGLDKVIRSESFAEALKICLQSDGVIAVIGMGKSGLVGQKIAATLTSTGTAAVAIHAGEALHGDLGAIRPGDVALLISKSGETREVLSLIPFLRDQKNRVIAITNESNSRLAQGADVTLAMNTQSEGCPLNLAPMNSSTATLVIGDALASALIVARDFRPESFARFHPGGNLGWLLTATVADMIDGEKNPMLSNNDTLRNAVVALVEFRLGGVNIVDEDGCLVGLVTDGDLKRIILDDNNGWLDKKIDEIMAKNPVSVGPDTSAAKALDLMERRDAQISVLPVVDNEHRPLGLLRLHDVIKSHL